MAKSLLDVRPFHPPFVSSHPRFSVKTGRWAGVVTAFISMSSIKDEIDWEFPGNATTEGQTNYFWQGNIRKLAEKVLRFYSHRTSLVAATTHGVTVTGLTDTYANWHDYTVCPQCDLVMRCHANISVRSTGNPTPLRFSSTAMSLGRY